nr:hypothetical protein [Tanacetum cinerariifolium]
VERVPGQPQGLREAVDNLGQVVEAAAGGGTCARRWGSRAVAAARAPRQGPPRGKRCRARPPRRCGSEQRFAQSWEW